jgi:hypothetical protein
LVDNGLANGAAQPITAGRRLRYGNRRVLVGQLLADVIELRAHRRISWNGSLLTIGLVTVHAVYASEKYA